MTASGFRILQYAFGDSELSTATIQTPSKGRSRPPRSQDSRWLNGRFVVTAAAVSALGLSNICRFPYLVSRHGGGAFVLVYLAAMVAIALPILMAELMVGRRCRVSPAECFSAVARDEGHTCRWAITGILASAAALLLLAAHAEGVGSAVSRLAGLDHRVATGAEIGWQGIFLGSSALIASKGLRSGLRPLYSRLLLVALLFLAALLAYSGSTSQELQRSLLLVFQPDFKRMTWWGVVDAGRLALLTVGVGLGAVVSYGTGISDTTSIFRASAVALLSTTALVLLGAVAALAVSASAGYHAFLLMAGLGGAIAVLNPLIEHLGGWTGLARLQAALLVGALAWAIAAAIDIAGGSPSIEWLEGVGVNLLMPGAALCGILFVGWAMSRRSTRMGLGLHPAHFFVVWRWLIRYPVPLLLSGILVLGLLELIT